jgi:hypothetical protein
LNFGQTAWDKTQVLLELDKNTLGTREKTKNPCPPLFQKEKNWNVHECMLSLHIGCMKFFFPKLFVTIFGLG